ncbi:hypothetical protein HON36_03580 [Candidatus Parcubacteria bacterium]|jgi:hypothetical protein|nr:hypothetical protein [Candidatus Parcubacteria bacterium]
MTDTWCKQANCSHCGGKTKCNCSTCGGNQPGTFDSKPNWCAGICKVCKGSGKVPNPYYDPKTGQQ